MSKEYGRPRTQYTVGNERSARGQKNVYARQALPEGHQMKLGKPTCLSERKGTFKGKGSDLRSEQGGGRFRSGIPSQDTHRGSATSHAKQPK